MALTAALGLGAGETREETFLAAAEHVAVARILVTDADFANHVGQLFEPPPMEGLLRLALGPAAAQSVGHAPELGFVACRRGVRDIGHGKIL